MSDAESDVRTASNRRRFRRERLLRLLGQIGEIALDEGRTTAAWRCRGCPFSRAEPEGSLSDLIDRHASHRAASFAPADPKP